MYFSQKRERRARTKNFEQWLAESWKYKKWDGNSKQDQFHQISIDEKICVDFLIRFESLQADFDHVCKELGAELVLSHLNKSDHQHYSNYYDDAMVEFVRKWHKRDIEEFGYEYNRDGDVMRGEDHVCPDSQGSRVLLF